MLVCSLTMSRLTILMFFLFTSAGSIVLKDEKFNFRPQNYYIQNVAEGRAARNVVAILVQRNKKSPVSADLKNGAVKSVKNFLDRNLHRDTTLMPVLVTIKEFKITETRLPDGSVSGEISVFFSFSSQLSYQNKHLVDFNKVIHYKRLIGDPPNAETKLRGGLMEGLTFFNNWMKHSPRS